MPPLGAFYLKEEIGNEHVWYTILMATIALIIAQEGFQTKEYNDTKHVLESAGHKVLTISMHKGISISNINEHIASDMTMEELTIDTVDGAYLIGGPGALRSLDNEVVYNFFQKVKNKIGMPFGAICISTRILAKAHVLEGIRATGWNGDKQLAEILSANGATYVPNAVVEDGRVVTADGPASGAAFGSAIAKQFAVT